MYFYYNCTHGVKHSMFGICVLSYVLDNLLLKKKKKQISWTLIPTYNNLTVLKLFVWISNRFFKILYIIYYISYIFS